MWPFGLLRLMRGVIVAVGEQPPSSMTPVILESESGGLLVVGGSGGSMITSAVALVSPLKPVFAPLSILWSFYGASVLRQAIMNRLWLKMSLEDAIAAPIVFVDSENNVKLERGFDEVRRPESLLLVLEEIGR